jgi:hypothetical protein
LERILSLHEENAPTPPKRKFELVNGNASLTVPEWLDVHPEAIVAMVNFEVDVYEPTRDALVAVFLRLVRVSVLAFGELNFPGFQVRLLPFGK